MPLMPIFDPNHTFGGSQVPFELSTPLFFKKIRGFFGNGRKSNKIDENQKAGPPKGPGFDRSESSNLNYFRTTSFITLSKTAPLSPPAVIL